MEYKASGRKKSVELSEKLKAVIQSEIDNARELKNINNVQLAELMEMTKQQLWNTVNRNNLSVANIETIANALDCDVEIKFVPKDKKGE